MISHSDRQVIKNINSLVEVMKIISIKYQFAWSKLVFMRLCYIYY